MKKHLILISILIASCQTTPQNPDNWMEKEQNSCLPTAITFKESLKKYNIWAEVVHYGWRDAATQKSHSHAVLAYIYPKGKNKLWTYDFLGSYRTRAYIDNPVALAQQAQYVRGNYNKITFAEYVK